MNTKSADKQWFIHDRFGMFLHWGLYSLPARHEWVKKAEQINNTEYRKYFDHFNPDLYNPREWARMAREAGMKYFVITTKHHEGFCLWDTKYTDYKATNTPCGKDVLKPMVDAFREEGLRVGFYYSLLDWHHPDYTIDKHHPMHNNEQERSKNASRNIKNYAEYMRNQVRELLTEFGPIDILWFDFSFPGDDGKGKDDWESEKLYALVRELQPGILIDNRLDLPGVGDFATPEQQQVRTAPCDENGNPLVWEACHTFSGSWGYHRDEQTWKSVPMLLQMLIDGVSKGGNLLLNVGPTSRGEFDYRAQERLKGMGEWMRTHSRSIYGCGPAPETCIAPHDCRYTWNPETNRLYLHLFAWPFKTIYCPNLAGKVVYAQLLHDGSEVKFRENPDDPEKGVVFHIPAVKPLAEIPVIELFLKRK